MKHRQDTGSALVIAVFVLALITSITMYLNQPGALIQISAVIGFLGTLIYGTALAILNHGHLRRQMPQNLQSGRLSLLAIIVTLVFYYLLAGAYIYFKWFYNG